MPGTGQQEKRNNNMTTGGLNIAMCIACLLSVAVVSFGVAWLMKGRVRSFWEMGLTFAAPFAALMISALLVEKVTCRMTPACSRKAQTLFALVTVVAAFVIGCLSEVLHQPVVIEHVEPEYDYVIILDKSGSMVFTELDKPCQKALHSLMDEMEDECRVGIVAFSDMLAGKAEIGLLDETQRARISSVIDTEIPIEETRFSRTGPGTDFSLAMDEAMKLVKAMPDRTRPIRMILVTDGDEDSHGDFNAFKKWAKDLNEQKPETKQIELCAVQLGDPMLSMVKDAVKATGGKVFDQTEITELANELKSLKSTLVIPEAVDTLKATYEGKTADDKPNTPYVILTGVLLLLQGLLCGISLRIMFSVQGQFRFQIILSALMGICAFLLLNYGRYIGISPAWICEGLAFSLFGIVLMRTNRAGSTNKQISPGSPEIQDTGFDTGDDF